MGGMEFRNGASEFPTTQATKTTIRDRSRWNYLLQH
jgi:hypothetical protein